MNASQTHHPSDQVLRNYGLGQLNEAGAETVDRHLERCTACRNRVAEHSPDSFLARLRDAQGGAAAAAPVVSSTTDRPARSAAGGSPAVRKAVTLPPRLAEHPDYEIVRELGRGGMGVVYLARNRLMGRLEVLKVLGGHLVERSGALDRFLVEIQNAARLQHQNIVTAYSAMRFGDDLVLAMEHIEGFDLARVVKAKGPLPVGAACNYAHQVAMGLKHAHEHGMVHRDIKPGNLMLDRQAGRPLVKILDFGLAKVRREQSPASSLTQPGQLLGTPAYMAPEQMSDARNADIRADIYSLGCTLYYLLTAAPPFQGSNLYEVLQAHQSMEAMPLNLARPDVPVQIAVIVATMMAKEPERRFQTPGHVAQALAPFLKKEGPSTTQESMLVISQGAGASDAGSSRGVEPVVPRPAETALAPAQPAPSTSAKSADSDFATLIEIDHEGDLSKEIQAIRETRAFRASRAWVWPSAAVAAGLLGLGVVLGMSMESSKDRESHVRPAPTVASHRKIDRPAPPRKRTEETDAPAPPASFPPFSPSPPPAPPIAETSVTPGGDAMRKGADDKDKPGGESGSGALQPGEMNRGKGAILEARKPGKAAETPAEDGSPDAMLRKRGLTKKVERKRIYYVVRTESSFWEMFNTKVRPTMISLDEAGTALATARWIAQYLHGLDLEITRLQLGIQDLNAQIGGLGNAPLERAAKQQLVATRNEAAANLRVAQEEFILTKKQEVPPARMRALEIAFEERMRMFKDAASELLPIYEKLLEEYRQLKKDPEVENEFKTLRPRFVAQVDLGPSGDLNLAVRQVRELHSLVTGNPEMYMRRRPKPRLKERPRAVPARGG